MRVSELVTEEDTLTDQYRDADRNGQQAPSLDRQGSLYDGPKGCSRDLFGLERLPRALHHASAHLIERDERRVSLGLDLDLPLSTIRTLEGVAVPGRENGMAMDDYRAIGFFDGKKLVPRALAQRFRRLVGLVDVRGLRGKRQRRDDCDAGLDAGLTQRREKSHLVDRFQSYSVGDVAQKSFGGLYHARAFEV